MTLLLRDMRPEEAGRIAAMVAGLARDVGATLVPQLTGDKLKTRMRWAARDTAEARFARGTARKKLKKFEGARSDFEAAAKDPRLKEAAQKELDALQ